MFREKSNVKNCSRGGVQKKSHHLFRDPMLKAGKVWEGLSSKATHRNSQQLFLNCYFAIRLTVMNH